MPSSVNSGTGRVHITLAETMMGQAGGEFDGLTAHCFFEPRT